MAVCRARDSRSRVQGGVATECRPHHCCWPPAGATSARNKRSRLSSFAVAGGVRARQAVPSRGASGLHGAPAEPLPPPASGKLRRSRCPLRLAGAGGAVESLGAGRQPANGSRGRPAAPQAAGRALHAASSRFTIAAQLRPGCRRPLARQRPNPGKPTIRCLGMSRLGRLCSAPFRSGHLGDRQVVAASRLPASEQIGRAHV